MKKLAKIVCGFIFATHLQSLWANSKMISKNELEQRVLQLEKIWNTGDSLPYFEKATELYEQIESLPEDSLKSETGGKILKNLLAKEVKPDPENSTLDLSTLEKGVALLIEDKSSGLDLRRTNARLLCMFRGRIHRELIVNFSPKSVVENVAPPPGVPGMTGMSPEAIKDPAARAKYEAAILENQQNAIVNSRQKYLESLNKKHDAPIKKYLTSTFVGKSQLTGELKECLKFGGFGSEQQSEILEKIK